MNHVAVPSLRRVCIATLLAVLAVAPAAVGQTLPTFAKSFFPDTIGPGSVATLRFDITAASPVRNGAFVDNLPAGMTIANPPNVTSGCIGSVSAPAGGSTITFSGGDVAGSCSITVDVTTSTPGASLNTTGDFTSSAGNSGPASATLTVDTGRPGFAKSFSPSSIFFGGRSTLTFTIDNTANAAGATNMTFIDNLPPGMVIASPSNATNGCGGGVLSAPAGGSTISLGFGSPAATVAAGASCSISVDVVGNAAGSLGNTSGDLTTAPLPFGTLRSSGMAAAVLTVTVQQIAIEKSFVGDPVAPGDTVMLQFTIRNLDRRGTATDIELTDDLDAVLSGLEAISLPSAPCGPSSSITGIDVLTFTGGELASEGVCTFSVTLQVPAGAASASYLNTTSVITADVGGSPVVGDPASDLLFVAPVPILTKTFIGDPVSAGGTVILELSITNTSTTSTATDITFEDVFVEQLPAASFVPPSGICGGATVFYTPLIDSPTGNTPARLVITGGELAPEDSCTFSLTLDVAEAAASGTYPNVTSDVTATIDGETVTGNPASDSFDVVAAPTLIKEFTDDPAAAGGTVTLELTLIHDEGAPGDATGVMFTDDLTATLSGLIAIDVPKLDVCGEGSEIDGATNLSFTGGTLAPGESCTFFVTLEIPAEASPGSYNNTTSNVVATVLDVTATARAASDDLQVAGLVLTKEFTDDPVLPGGQVNLRFTIDNVSPSSNATDIFFQDNLDTAVDNMVTVPTNLVLTNVCGVASATLIAQSGGRFLTFSGGALSPTDPPCVIDVTLQVPAGTEPGFYLNRTQNFRATIDGTPNVEFENPSDALEVVSDLLELTKEFIDDPVGPGDAVTLRFTLANLSTEGTIEAIAFNDDLEAVISGLEATGLPSPPTCGGTVMGTSTISFFGGSLEAGEVCSFDVTLTVPEEVEVGTVATNVTSDVTGTLDGLPVTGDPAIDELSIDFNLFTKSFGAGVVFPGDVVSLTFTLENLDPENSDNLLNFTDNLEAVIPGLEPIGLPMFDVCGEESVLEVAEVEGDVVLLFSQGTLLPGGSCTFSVDLQVPEEVEPGDFENVTSDLMQGTARAAGPATAEISVELPPTFSKSFSPDTILEGEISTLTLSIDNSGSTLPAEALDFTDVFPEGLVIADPANASTTCTGGTLTAVAGTDTVAYTGGSVAAGESCSVQVDVAPTTFGELVNVTGDLTSTSGNSGSATATLTVIEVADDDNDGVLDAEDLCPGTVIPEGVPTVRLGRNRYALVDEDFTFDTNPPPGGGPGDVFTTTDTGGCSCEQIIEELELGNGHTKFGCSLSAMRDWADVVKGGDGGGTEPPADEVKDGLGTGGR